MKKRAIIKIRGGKLEEVTVLEKTDKNIKVKRVKFGAKPKWFRIDEIEIVEELK